MKLINSNVVVYRGKVTDRELIDRLRHEAMADANFLDENGKPLKGVSAKLTRFGGKAPTGGYDVEVSRDLSQSDQKLLPGSGGNK